MKLYLILLAIFLLGCETNLETIKQKKISATLNMDLGMALWKRHLLLFDGDIKKTDSAYTTDKKILIDDIYKSVDKVEKKQKGL